jgi:predicted kinase
MKTVYITRGLPASGKTTWAKEMQSRDVNIVRVNKDDLRAMLHNGRWSRANEEEVLKLRDQIIKNSLALGKHIIVDDTNLSQKHINVIKTIAKPFDARVVIQDFTGVPLEECIARDKTRFKPVGEEVIRDMHKRFLAVEPENKPLKPLVFNDKLPFCVIFDLDGTLACIGNRSPYDSKNCAQDYVNISIDYLRSLLFKYSGAKVIIFSGRKDDAEEETKLWLLKNGMNYDELHMRRADDNRKDSLIKLEMFYEYIRDKYNVIFAVDDRDQVVKMWRDLGITCLQVNYGDF